ncbi:hypothetical protein AB0M83_44475 [Amycolatopsis sp. NPDC051106]|uniref:hypothetical protein n=1 Tax=unclassified Amycolatopsis TaxID=2618356 RepID=UPI00343075CA
MGLQQLGSGAIGVAAASSSWAIAASEASETLGVSQRLTTVIGWTWLIVLALRARRVAVGDRVESVAAARA